MIQLIKFIDLFAGIGGTRIGFNQALQQNHLKGKCVFSSEIKKPAIKVYQGNFPNSNLHGDITKIPSSQIPDFDYLLGGFPCQPFSSAGKELGFEDTRGTMFFQIARILKDKQPKGFLLENVPNLLTNKHGKTFHTIYHILLQLGYSIGYQVLDSSYFGLAQKRKRLYIIGKKSKHPTQIKMNIQGTNHNIFIKDIIDKSQPPKQDTFTKELFNHYQLNQIIGKRIRNNRGTSYNIHTWDFNLTGKTTKDERILLDKLIPECRKHIWARKYSIKWSDGMPLTEKMIRTFYHNPRLHNMLKDLVHKHYLVYNYPKQTLNHQRQYVTTVPKGYRIKAGALTYEYNKILNPNGRTPTLTATDMSRLAVPIDNGIRPLDAREGLRLFGFPDTYHMLNLTPNQKYNLLGNTICIPVVKAVANKLLKLN